MKIIVLVALSWCSVLVAGGIPSEQLPSHVKVGVVASREAHALSQLFEPVLVKKVQDQVQKLANSKDGTVDPETLGRYCNEVVTGFADELQKGLKKSRLQPQLVGYAPSLQRSSLWSAAQGNGREDTLDVPAITEQDSFSVTTARELAGTSALVCAEKTEKENREDQGAPTQLYKRVSMSGALQPNCAYRFDTDTVRRPITAVTSGSYVVYSALVLKNLWEKQWSYEQPSGEQDISNLVKEKSALVQACVKKMVEAYGEQKGPQIYVTNKMLQKMLSEKTFKDLEPFKNIFMFNQEKRLRVIEANSEVERWRLQENIEGLEKGETQKLLSLLARCTEPQEEACACVIDTFVNRPGPLCDHVLAFVSKKVGEKGPVFIYVDPLNRGMKKNPRAYIFLSFLLNQAKESRSMPEEKSLLGKLLESVCT